MRRFAHKNSEALVVFALFAVFGLLKITLANKVAMLNLYFIPVLVSGYFLGKKRAILAALASVLLAVLFFVRWPGELVETGSQLSTGLNILVWATLLLLSSILVSTLNESRQHRQATATFKLLEKYIRDVAMRDTHPARVGRLAREVADELKLHPRLIDSIEAAGLLHDISDGTAGIELIEDCISVGVGTGNTVIDGALPILIGNHRHVNENRPLPIGSRILKIADLYDSARSVDNVSEPWQLIHEIESKTDKNDGRLINALSRVVARRSF